MTIQLARNLSLPVEAQTQTFVLLAIRGAGKTYGCLKMAEGMYANGLQFVFVDPTGVSWGLRSSADGKRPGIPVLILGGERGDIPLEVGGGALVADLVVDEGVSCILDLSDFRKGQMTRFMCDFAERLYHRKRNRRDPLHVFLDEGDAFAPQRPMKEQARMLGAVEDLVRRGRSRGIGLTIATQRSAVLNKDVMTQCETLIAMCAIAPQDIKAVDEWLKHAGDDEKRARVLADLPNLETGEAWFWSPRALHVYKRAKILKRATFDSSATPKAGKRLSPKTIADVDLEAIRGRMAEVVERAEANDPKVLHARVRELERELTKARAVAPVDASEIARAVAAERDHIVGVIGRAIDTLAKRVRESVVPDLQSCVEAVRTDINDGVGRKKRGRKDYCTGPTYATPAETQAALASQAAHEKPKPQAKTRKPTTEIWNEVATKFVALPPAKQRILDALAFLEQVGVTPADRTQLALFADTSPKSSGYANNLGALRTQGLIDYPVGGSVGLTSEGRAAAQSDYAVRTSEDLHAILERKLPPAKWRIVEACIRTYPNAIDRNTLAEQAGTSPSSSGYANNLGSLRTLGLIDYPSRGAVRACDVLFLEGR